MTGAKVRRTKVFVSYSHKDEPWLEPLRDHLAVLGDGAVWIDSDAIEPGERWDDEIHDGLQTSRVAILLISASLVASRYVRETELPYLLDAAEAKQVTLLPIYLLPCEVPPQLAAYQAINSPDRTLADLQDDPADQARVWMRARQEIRKAFAEMIPAVVAAEDLDDAEEVLAGLETMGLTFDPEIYSDDDDPALAERVATRLTERQATLLFFGRRGLGLWAREGLLEALGAAQKAGRRLISGLLPTVPTDFGPPAALAANTLVRFPRGLADSTTVNRLWMGLTGRWQAPSASPALAAAALDRDQVEESPDTAQRFASEIASRLELENLTLFVGGDLAASGRPGAAEEEPLRLHELTRGLLEELGLDRYEPESLHLPLDVAGSYFAVRRGERGLESRLCDLIGQRRGLPTAHREIARLMRTLLDFETADRFSRRRQPPARLVVTTNFDLLLERALLLAGVPFVRVVQDRSGEKILLNAYEEVTLEGEHLELRSGEELRRVHRDDVDDLCEAITELGREEVVWRSQAGAADASPNPLRALPLERFKLQVVLYKLLGSEDIRNSCSLSTDQHLRLIRAVLGRQIVPLKIAEMFASGPALVLGYGLLDPLFRILWQCLPFTPTVDGESARHFLVREPPGNDDPDAFRRLEERLWAPIKKKAERGGFEVLERRGARFLDELTAELERRWGGDNAEPG